MKKDETFDLQRCPSSLLPATCGEKVPEGRMRGSAEGGGSLSIRLPKRPHLRHFLNHFRNLRPFVHKVVRHGAAQARMLDIVG
jgi:hypothetical protein